MAHLVLVHFAKVCGLHQKSAKQKARMQDHGSGQGETVFKKIYTYRVPRDIRPFNTEASRKEGGNESINLTSRCRPDLLHQDQLFRAVCRTRQVYYFGCQTNEEILRLRMHCSDMHHTGSGTTLSKLQSGVSKCSFTLCDS